MVPCFTVSVGLSAVIAGLTPPVAPGRAPESLPGDDAVVLKQEIFVVIEHDCRVTKHVRREMRIDSLQGIHFRSDWSIPYSRDDQELTIVEAATITAAGETVDVPPIAINTSTPDAVVESPAFSKLTETIVSFPAVEKGATLVLEYELKDVHPWRPHAEGVFFFGEDVPVRQSTLTVKVSARSRFHFLVFGPTGKTESIPPQMHRGHTVYRWSVRNLEAIHAKPSNRYSRVPGVAFSTAESWETLLDSLAGQVGRKLPLRALDFVVGKDVDHTGLRRLIRIAERMRTSFRTPGHALVFPMSLSLRNPKLVLETRQASPLEAAALVAGLLAAENLSARIVLASPPGLPLQPVPPCSSLMEHTFVEVSPGGHQLFIDMDGFRILHRIPEPGGRTLAVLPLSGRRYVTPAQGYLRNNRAVVLVTAGYRVNDERLDVRASIDARGAASLLVEWLEKGTNDKAAAWLASMLGPDLKVNRFFVDEISLDRFSVTIEAWRALEQSELPLAVPAVPLATALDPYLLRWVTDNAAPGLSHIQYAGQISVTGPLVSVATWDTGSVKEDSASYSTLLTQDTGITRLEVSLLFSSDRGEEVQPVPASIVAFVADATRSIYLLRAEKR